VLNVIEINHLDPLHALSTLLQHPIVPNSHNITWEFKFRVSIDKASIGIFVID
jgi:hypothetical protein